MATDRERRVNVDYEDRAASAPNLHTVAGQMLLGGVSPAFAGGPGWRSEEPGNPNAAWFGPNGEYVLGDYVRMADGSEFIRNVDPKEIIKLGNEWGAGWNDPESFTDFRSDPVLGTLTPIAYEKSLQALGQQWDDNAAMYPLAALAMLGGPVLSSMGVIGPGAGVTGYQGAEGVFGGLEGVSGLESVGATGAGAGGTVAGGTELGTGAFDMYGSLGTDVAGTVGGAGYVPVDAAAYTAATGGAAIPGAAYTWQGLSPTEQAELQGLQQSTTELTSGLNTMNGLPLTGPGYEALSTTAKTAIGRILKGQGTLDDWLQIGGTLAGTALDIAGSNAQSDAYKDIANKFWEVGAPHRARLEASYAPGFDYFATDKAAASGLDSVVNSGMRALSTQGNPWDNPGAQSQLYSDVYGKWALPALQNYRGQLGQFGGLGLNTSGQASFAGASGAADPYDAIGQGIGNLTASSNNSLEALLRKYYSTPIKGWGE